MMKKLDPTPKADILIVDDTPNNLRLLGQILGKQYKVRLAPSGQIALTAARSTPPDLILLDVMMPEMNGYEVAEQFKAGQQTKEIPIIFISALDDTDSKIRAFAAGGVDYVTKPFQEKEVLARVETHLSLRRLYKQAQEEIAERKQVEEKLRQSEERFRLMVNSTDDVVFTLDCDQRHTGVYGPWVEKNGLTANFFLGRTSREIFGEAAAIHEDANRRALQGASILYDWSAPGKNGIQNYQTSLSPLRNATGEIVGLVGIGRDITERKKAENELRASNAKFEILFQVSPLAIMLLDSNGNIQLWNTAAEQIFDYTSQEVIGHPNPIVPRDKQNEYTAWSAQILRGKPITNQETIRQRKDGSFVDVSISSAPIYDAAGNVTGRMAILTDITERKLAEANLHRVNTLMNLIVENIPNMIFLKDARELRFVRFNRAGENLLGYSRDDLLGKNDYDFFPQEQADFFTEKDRDVLRGNEVVDIPEEPLQTRNKGMRTLHTRKVTLRDANGEPEYLLGISEDITERKMVEENEHEQRILAESLRDIASVLNSTLDLDQVLDNILENASRVVSHDMACIMLINEKDEAYVVRERGYAEHGVQEAILSVRLRLAETPYLQEIVRTAKPVVVPDIANAPGWVINADLSLVRSWAGIPIIQKEKVTGFINLDSKTPGFFKLDYINRLKAFADQAAIAITNAQFAAQLEERVAQRTSELEAANLELENLSYNIAHDMRSPVRAMVGYSGILQQTHQAQLDSEGLQMLANIHTSGLRLGQMIDGFLAFLHLGHVSLHSQTVNTNGLVGKLLKNLELELKNRQIEFSVGALPECQADPKLLEQVWAQLISNALKFTRPREVARIEIGSGEADGRQYYFVRDNGVGFEMKYAGKLFGVFQKLHYESEFEGIGIGLAIAKRIIQCHGGKMWAEAEVDKGAVFYFTLSN